MNMVAKHPALAEITDLIEAYFDALYFGKVDVMRSLLHARAQYCCATEPTLDLLTVDEYLARMAGRTPPATLRLARADAIVGIDLIGPNMAVARLRCQILPKRFTDALTLIRVEGRWQIILKAFHFDLPEA